MTLDMPEFTWRIIRYNLNNLYVYKCIIYHNIWDYKNHTYIVNEPFYCVLQHMVSSQVCAVFGNDSVSQACKCHMATVTPNGWKTAIISQYNKDIQ